MSRNPLGSELQNVQSIEIEINYSLNELADELRGFPSDRRRSPVLENEKIKLQVSLAQIYEKLSKKPLKSAKQQKLIDNTIRLKMPSVGNLFGENLKIESINKDQQDYLIRSRSKFAIGEFLSENGKGLENISALKSHLNELGVVYS